MDKKTQNVLWGVLITWTAIQTAKTIKKIRKEQAEIDARCKEETDKVLQEIREENERHAKEMFNLELETQNLEEEHKKKMQKLEERKARHKQVLDELEKKHVERLNGAKTREEKLKIITENGEETRRVLKEFMAEITMSD